MLNLLLSGMRPIIAAAKLLLFCHLGKFFSLFFHKTAEIVAFTPFSATISSPFQPIDTPSAAHVFGAEIMDGSLEKTDAEREIIGAFAEDIVRIAEGTFTLPEGTFTVAEGIFTVAEGIFRIIARRDMDISWLEMIVAELDTGIACHEITLMGCCMGM
ncbi:unknown [Prevotella sp. CAG:474]|nr:unknown [Prevotella sp. CAG:474]